MTVLEALGWCQCGEPDWVETSMRAYLTPDSGGLLAALDDATMVLAYVAHAQEWTEHGSSITFSWLTPKGVAFVASLAPMPDQDTES
jgi:hypothetical protein